MRTLAEWLTLHESVHPKSIDMGLARIGTVARALGVVELAFPVITVAGTNGKGSTVAHLEALLRSLGACTGIFTSPHFNRYNERIRIDGREVADTELIGAFERIEAARGAVTLTFFEYSTLAALLTFEGRAVDVAVLASVGFDHRDWLGDTLDLIGAEKAGIFRAARPAVLGTPDMPASVFASLKSSGAQAIVAERDFRWQVRSGSWDYYGLHVTLPDLPPSALAGSIQYRNAATALAAVEALRGGATARAPLRALQRRLAALDRSHAAAALERVQLPGRFQIVPGAVEWILDIAHNEPAARVLASLLRERPLPAATGGVRGRTLAVIGVLADKDAAAIGAALAPVIDHWILCTLPGPRGTSAAELAARLALPASSFELAASVPAGLELARLAARDGDRIVVCGSFFSVGPALKWLRIY
jgi:dihydrofolate synthase/folylpolyglutamate synthase